MFESQEPESVTEIEDKTDTSNLPYSYCFLLRLGDMTGELNCIVSGDAASSFLYGYPPCNLNSNNCSRDGIKRLLLRLMEPECLLDVCIASYQSANGEICYKLFGSNVI